MNRRYELDWLRIFGILTVFLYHSSRFFNLGDWHIKNVNTYVWVEVWNVFATRWMMPLFFVISGASLFHAIGKSGSFRKFYVNKFLRLMIPVLVASVTHGALQVYLDRLTHGQFSGSFFSFLPEYFNGIYMAIGMPGNFAFHGMHLWYLLFLFLYSLIFYHMFKWLKIRGDKVLNRITGLFALPGLMYIWFLFPLVFMKALIPSDILSPGSGGWGYLYYIWFLISGFMIVSNAGLIRNIKKQRWISLVLGVVLSIVYLCQMFSQARVDLPFLLNDWIISFLSFTSAWCWLFAILGFGMQHMCFDRPLLRYVNEGVLPFFILHQTVLLIIGYFTMSLDIHDVLKWVIVTAVSFIVIIFIHIFLIRKLDLLRFLFGMKTTNPFFNIFRKRIVLIILTVLYAGLIFFAVVNHINNVSAKRSPMPLVYDPEHDIIITSETITDKSSTGVSILNDQEASKGRAIEFVSGANDRPVPRPKVFVEMRFFAPAGRYIIWIRGKSNINSGYTDSFWLQLNDQIGTQRGIRLGNWLDVHPVGIYGWASDTDDPISIELKHTGDHRILIQPRQTPHRIDQIWLSRAQDRIPDTLEPIK
jgi:fucose 4-O-acetylase-like acetyltransferase